MGIRSWGPSFFILIAVGCAAPEAEQVVTGTTIPTMNSAEPDYCSSASMISGAAVTISGGATYQARQVFTSGGGGLGGAGSAMPIRYAEVKVINNTTGATVQCAETDSSGNYSFIVPQSSTVYTVKISARARNSHAKVDVFDDPRYNNYYSIQGTFTATGGVTLSTINAGVTGSVLGGAFNILDQIVDANAYLTSTVGNCSGSLSGCANFSVSSTLPKLNVYWKLGFNPNEYYSSSSPLSFYLPGYSRLFILGGSNGDVDSSDTDHFDNSVVLHEYGHFLEDAAFISDSPGGSHNGNKVIDPRLAWSEGWGNFFQAAVRGDNHYIDTIGNSSGATELAFYVDIESQTTDVPIYAGEGNFREFSVTRLLWDAIDNTPAESSSQDNIDSAFNQVWHALTKTDGWLNTHAAFRSVGLLHAIQSTFGTTSWAGIRTIEKHNGTTSDYAQYVATGSSCVSFTLTPATIAGDTGSFATSHLLKNNDFYHLPLNSSAAVTVRLDYQDADGAGSEADVDLYVYKSSARFGVASDLAGYSQESPDTNPATAQIESVSATLGAGDYLINVNVYTGGASVGGAFNYSLKLNGSQLCPTALP